MNGVNNKIIKDNGHGVAEKVDNAICIVRNDGSSPGKDLVKSKSNPKKGVEFLFSDTCIVDSCKACNVESKDGINCNNESDNNITKNDVKDDNCSAKISVDDVICSTSNIDSVNCNAKNDGKSGLKKGFFSLDKSGTKGGPDRGLFSLDKSKTEVGPDRGLFSLDKSKTEGGPNKGIFSSDECKIGGPNNGFIFNSVSTMERSNDDTNGLSCSIEEVIPSNSSPVKFGGDKVSNNPFTFGDAQFDFSPIGQIANPIATKKKSAKKPNRLFDRKKGKNSNSATGHGGPGGAGAGPPCSARVVVPSGEEPSSAPGGTLRGGGVPGPPPPDESAVSGSKFAQEEVDDGFTRVLTKKRGRNPSGELFSLKVRSSDGGPISYRRTADIGSAIRDMVGYIPRMTRSDNLRILCIWWRRVLACPLAASFLQTFGLKPIYSDGPTVRGVIRNVDSDLACHEICNLIRTPEGGGALFVRRFVHSPNFRGAQRNNNGTMDVLVTFPGSELPWDVLIGPLVFQVIPFPLPVICFRCGMGGHKVQSCPKGKRNDNDPRPIIKGRKQAPKGAEAAVPVIVLSKEDAIDKGIEIVAPDKRETTVFSHGKGACEKDGQSRRANEFAVQDKVIDSGLSNGERQKSDVPSSQDNGSLKGKDNETLHSSAFAQGARVFNEFVKRGGGRSRSRGGVQVFSGGKQVALPTMTDVFEGNAPQRKVSSPSGEEGKVGEAPQMDTLSPADLVSLLRIIKLPIAKEGNYGNVETGIIINALQEGLDFLRKSIYFLEQLVFSVSSRSSA